MFPINRSNKCFKTLTRSALLGGIACVTLYLGACDITGASYKSGPVKLPSSKNASSNNESMTNEVSRLEESKIEAERGEPAPQSNLNPKNLFGKNLKSDGERLDRLERSMQDLRNEFDSVKPSIKRLMAIEADIQNLVEELRKMSDEVNSTPAPQNVGEQQPEIKTPAPKMATPSKAPKTQTKTPPPVSEGVAVYDVRIGEHPSKTRIVLDTNAKTSFSVDIDNNEKIMVVDLPQAKWSAASSKNISSKTLTSYRVEASENGSLLIFQLKKEAQLLSQNEIGGSGGQGNRIVIDLK